MGLNGALLLGIQLCILIRGQPDRYEIAGIITAIVIFSAADRSGRRQKRGGLHRVIKFHSGFLWVTELLPGMATGQHSTTSCRASRRRARPRCSHDRTELTGTPIRSAVSSYDSPSS